MEHPSSIKSWFMAIRPKTLPAAFSPVMIGTAMAYGDGVHDFPTAILCLWAALAIQIGTNLANDYYDFKHGVDTSQRIGPTRVTQSGLISPNHVLWGFILSFVFAAIIAFFLYLRAGASVLVIAVLSILSGLFYTAGPKPLGYIGLGDLFVLVFFGPVAVAGTYFVQSLEMNAAVILAGLAPGLLSVAILCINNLRDIESDAKSGKRTLAVRFGREFAHTEYLFTVLLAALIPIIIFVMIQDHLPIVFASFIGLMAIPGFETALTKTDGPSLNETLAFTGKLLLIYSILFSAGWLL